MLIILRSLADEQRHDNSNNEANSNEADEDYVIKEDDVALDNYGKVDMERVFPNADHDNPSQSSTSTPGTGLVLARVLLLDFCLKVPRNEVDLIHSGCDENGGVLVDVECRFKKTEEDDITHSK
ncbi:hypothetical protein MHU86_7582 [Fragilaria crotonensis]|nr:hypothetical protein MHU86_11061 [Fragilaria crotonensis]KAI2506797.1 hypothetical protein MHU86_7582 [Fragilaria crotonensis]